MVLGTIGVRAVATAVTVTCLLAACSGGAAESTPAAATARATSSTEPRPRIPAEPSAQLLREERLFLDPAPLGAIQEEYGVAPVILEQGTYTFDELGIDLTLTLPDHWRLDRAVPGQVVLTRPDAELDSLLPGLLFVRPIGFADPQRAATETLFPGSTGWEPWALGDWIEAMPQIVVLDEGRVEVDGRTVRWWDVDVDPEQGRTNEFCEPGSCVTMMWAGHRGIFVARDLERIRWYEIPDPQGQIIVFVAGRDEEWDELVADADEVVRTTRFGSSQPLPVPPDLAIATVSDIAANVTWRFAGIDGLTLTTETFVTIEQRPGEVKHWAGRPGATIGVVVPLSDRSGAPIENVDDLRGALTGAGGTVVDTAVDLLGTRAVLVDLVHADDDPVLFLSEAREGYDMIEAGWPTEERNRVWIFDSPLGPTLLAASGEDDDALDAALDRFDFFVDAIGFCPTTDSCVEQR